MRLRILVLSVAFSGLFLAGCGESKQERYAREAHEMTLQCPIQLDAYTVLDSMAYSPEAHCMTYFYKVSNLADSFLLENRSQMEMELRQKVFNSTETLPYLEDKVTLRYVYHTDSTSALLDFVVSPTF